MTSSKKPAPRPRSRTTIFRPEAIEHHRLGEDAVRLPHYATVPVRIAMWSLIAVVLLAGGLAFTATVPRYASGRAFVVDTPQGPLIATLFPPGERPQLHAGEVLSVTFDRSPAPVVASITAVLPPAPSTGTFDSFLGLPPGTGASGGDPPVTAVATLPPSPAPVPAGSIGDAAVETGRQSLLSWIVP